MIGYRIEHNHKYNSNEVYFAEKPSDEIRDALKALKMRWNSNLELWYGFASEDEINDAIYASDHELGGETSEGYMGATCWEGYKSGKHLYGSDLSKAIRKEIKAHKVKGVTVSCKTFSGGQEIIVKIAVSDNDLENKKKYVDDYKIDYGSYWLYFKNDIGKVTSISINNYLEKNADEQEAIRVKMAEYEYNKIKDSEYGIDINHYVIDKYTELSPEVREKVKLIDKILDTYNYDDSNGMVDYFNTNFYRQIKVVYKAA